MKKMEKETKEQEESEDLSGESAFQMHEETVSAIQRPDQGKLIIPLKLKTTSCTQHIVNCETQEHHVRSCQIEHGPKWNKARRQN